LWIKDSGEKWGKRKAEKQAVKNKEEFHIAL
jgi:hypothetical protein